MKTYKVVHPNEYEYHIKEGRRILDKIQKVKDGFYVACKVFVTVDDALNYWKGNQENLFYVMTGERVMVEFDRVDLPCKNFS